MEQKTLIVEIKFDMFWTNLIWRIKENQDPNMNLRL